MLVAPVMLVQEVPPLALSCHWTVGVGFPVAAAEKVAVVPATTVTLVGWVVMLGASFTVSVTVEAAAVSEIFKVAQMLHTKAS